ncbi:carboxypeptidase-like regulatory domain-containing protein [Prevotella fusca JCM 17724]|uniref:Carboxypeptidase-like regulatory domain-containing protein n=1 Tax=Prevotella fusca JCM 17724 TaxID=1236517 RepID=A0A0K1NMB5_9BACT|nr:carboxypeptidase-like regulatory domain-containing protein [Prevotella fusca]AKU69831.1 membrane receptor RagA [Prevotella fusca JCM 17724]QUB85444.1 carboxypeptidase-like regulatory domain-containing protein [Prevotella fusca JCM 17724]
MTKGKSTCKLLKDIRQQIADANGISYRPKECHYEGECSGTCPACEEEIRYLERELKARKGNGFGMKVAGIAAGVCATVMPMAAMVQSVSSDNTSNSSVPATMKDTAKFVDFSNGRAGAVLVRGQVIFEDDEEPVIGAKVQVMGSENSVLTDLDGMFAVKVVPDASLLIKCIGCADRMVRVKDLSHSSMNFIKLSSEEVMLLGEVVFVKPNYDDVYGHRTDKPKSHKEKSKKNR